MVTGIVAEHRETLRLSYNEGTKERETNIVVQLTRGWV